MKGVLAVVAFGVLLLVGGLVVASREAAPAADPLAGHIRATAYPSPEPYSAAQWQAACTALDRIDGLPYRPNCEQTLIIDCPPDCDVFALATARASVRRIF